MVRLKSYSEGYNNENEPTGPGSPTPYPSRSPSLGHSNWPLPNLDTILERSDSRSLRSIASAPKLCSSPQRSPVIVKTKNSIHSIRPLQSHLIPWPVKQSLPTTQISNHKSFSAPDLDCTQKTFAYQCSPGSSSSSQALKSIPLNPAAPGRPPVEPILRCPTPDGLPSFGTKEAQELRLQPETAFMRRAQAIAQWIQGERGTSDEVLSEGSPGLSAAERTPVGPMGSTSGQDRSVPMDMLQRLFGAPRVVETSDHSSNLTPRVGLPRGISMADSPGVLATAPDGTCIRGKFGARMSAHGVGARSMANHPLARPGSEQKARSEQGRTHMHSLGSASMVEASWRNMQHGDSLAQEPWSGRMSRGSSVASPRAHRQSNQTVPTSASNGSPTMREPVAYPPPLHDRTDGASHQEPERDEQAPEQVRIRERRDHERRRRQQRLTEKEEEHCCHDYWEDCCDPAVPEGRNPRRHTAASSRDMGAAAAVSSAMFASSAFTASCAPGAFGGCHSATGMC